MVSSLMTKTQQPTDDDASLEVELWNYALGFTKMAVVKCAVELGIGDAISSQESPLTLSQLASTLGCDPSLLYRVMRFLVHHRIFEEKSVDDTFGYVHTPLSRRLLTRQDGKTMIDVLLLESSPVMLAPWHYLSSIIKLTNDPRPPFEQAHGVSLFEYTGTNPEHSKLLDDAMSNIAKSTVPAVVQGCPELVHGLKTVVDVGGGNGTASRLLVKSFPWIEGINFDLPHVVKVAPEIEGVKHVGGDMFHSVPKADAVFIMQVLHDWNDEECIEILKRCREAMSDGGKVIIVEAVVDEEKEDKFEQVRLLLDMVMMAHTTNGKERTLKEWEHVLHQSGFSRITVTPIKALQSVIQAFL
ncbi:Acetylserotonin O-methyltransferase [Linum perenne]